MPVGSISATHTPSARERGAQGVAEHKCGKCSTPFGVSAIGCPNDLVRLERERLLRVAVFVEKLKGAR